MIAHQEPFPVFEIAGRKLVAAQLTPDRLRSCNIIGQGLRTCAYGHETLHAVATIIAAMVSPNHPDVRPRDLVGHLTYQHFQQSATELARQLLAATPAQGRA